MFYIGLDLGKRLDCSALAVLERPETARGFDYLHWMQRNPTEKALVVRYLERIQLGTPYTQVVTRLQQVNSRLRENGKCQLVVDATGVGMPVVDMLRAAKLDCTLTPVLITS